MYTSMKADMSVCLHLRTYNKLCMYVRIYVCIYCMYVCIYVCVFTMPPTYLTASWAFKSMALKVGLTVETFPTVVSPWVRAWMNF